MQNTQDIEKSLYDKVKAVADDRGLAICEVEKRAGLANGTISKWRTGGATAESLRAVSLALCIPLEKLF